jgi:hypothetical protein
MNAPTSDIQYLFQIQIQQNNDKRIYFKIQNCDILFQMFWKKTLKFSSLKPHIFFILSSFWMILKTMDVPINDL